jgi:hypothetical protein
MTPTVRESSYSIAEWHAADEHADALVQWVLAAGFRGSVLSTDMMELHRQMCRELGWLPRKWNPVARAVCLQTTGGKKIYAHVEGRRLRIYPLHSVTTLARVPRS